MKPNLRIVLPILVVLLGIVGATGLLRVRPSVATHSVARPLPMVRAMTVELQDVQLRIEAQGSVTPRTESDLVAEVAGRITWVSPSLAAGGFFEEGELLAQIDASDYELAVERAEAALTRAESELALAQSHLKRRQSLAERGVASPATLDEAVNTERVANAAVRDARALRGQARRDLERSRILAPFAGRVREKRIGVGQFVGRGAGVARIYAVDYAEVRLPIPDQEAAFVDLPIDYRGEAGEVAIQHSTAKLRHRSSNFEDLWVFVPMRALALPPGTEQVELTGEILISAGDEGATLAGFPISFRAWTAVSLRSRSPFSSTLAASAAAPRGSFDLPSRAMARISSAASPVSSDSIRPGTE